jgi:RHS repeat-associated protein
MVNRDRSVRLWRLACLYLMLGLWLGIAQPGFAQRFPSQARGNIGDTFLQAGELDRLNLFNGNLSVELPLGKSYPVGPEFNFELGLTYNSKLWDHDEKTCVQSFPTQTIVYYLPVPDRLSNAGPGWTLSAGMLLEPSLSNPVNPGGRWVYVSPDGGQHAFFDRLHPGYPATPNFDVRYSNDSSYLRMKVVEGSQCRDVAGTTNTCRVVEQTDGKVREFREFGIFDWRLVRIKDPSNNTVDIDYGATTWTFTDSFGRSQVVEFVDGRARYVRLTAFDESIATYELVYQQQTIRRHDYFKPSCAPPGHGEEVVVHLLTKIRQPDTSFYLFDYHLTDVGGQLSGGLKKLQFPTGGAVGWDYTLYLFPQPVPTIIGHPASGSHGVQARTTYKSDGSVEGIWSYEATALGNPMAPGDGTVPCFQNTTVVDPMGNATEYFFATQGVEHRWSYGLPYSYCSPAGAYSDDGPFLSQRIWSGAAGTGTLLRSVWVEYDSDGLANAAEQNHNNRLRYSKVIFADDGSRYREDTFSDFDGLGKWRNRVRGGSFGEVKTTNVNYRPGGGTLKVDPDTSMPMSGNSFQLPDEEDPWRFQAFDRASQAQTGSSTLHSESCFDAAGRVIRHRQLAGTSRQAKDLVRFYVRNNAGYPLIEKIWGGDGNSTPTVYTDLCSMATPTGNPEYQIENFWAHGGLASSAFVDPCDLDQVVSLVDRDIDSATGLPSSSRDSAGLQTVLIFDEMNRLTDMQPSDGGYAELTYQFPTMGPSPGYTVTSTIASVLVEGCPNGEEGCLSSQRGWSRYIEFDGQGRLSRIALALPTEASSAENQDRLFTYNSMGWTLSESTWKQLSQTQYSNHDTFGRPGQINPPGGDTPVTDLTYKGERRLTRRQDVETAAGSVSNWVTEERDHFGRLIGLCEAQSSAPGESCSGLLTTYFYDAADRLVKVCHAASGSSCGQSRYFTYDGRGFLVSEQHPEIGASGNGTMSYLYDAQGNPTQSQVVGSSDFTLQLVYDRAGRNVLTNQWTATGWRRLKEFTYAKESDGGNLKGGKLVSAKRYNWVDPLGPLLALGDIPAVVTDTYRYEGVAGAVSEKTTSFRLLSSTNAFTSHFERDDFGNLTRIVYPRAQSWPFNPNSGEPYRQIDMGYKLGFLTSVNGYAPSITYQQGGVLNQVDYATGAQWTQTLSTSNYLPRPNQINLTGVASGFQSGTYAYDGVSNIKSIGTQAFQYDRLNRLTLGDTLHGSSIQRQTASYDDFGNVQSLISNGVTLSTSTSNLTNRLTGASYDVAGNVVGLTAAVGGAVFSYNYDGLRKMISLQSNAHFARLNFYDAGDERIFMWDCPLNSCGNGTNLETWTLRGLRNEVLRVYGGQDKFGTDWQADYVYRDATLLALVKPLGDGETRQYAAVDHLGSVRQVFDAANASVEKRDFFAFGGQIGAVGSGGIPFKFTGHERDENGAGRGALDNMHARFGSPALARFMSVDPVFRGSPYSSQSWNRFAYVENRPLNWVDPTGLEGEEPLDIGFADEIVVVDEPLPHQFFDMALWAEKRLLQQLEANRPKQPQESGEKNPDVGSLIGFDCNDSWNPVASMEVSGGRGWGGSANMTIYPGNKIQVTVTGGFGMGGSVRISPGASLSGGTPSGWGLSGSFAGPIGLGTQYGASGGITEGGPTGNMGLQIGLGAAISGGLSYTFYLDNRCD